MALISRCNSRTGTFFMSCMLHDIGKVVKARTGAMLKVIGAPGARGVVA
jgi:hypothetical protein